MKKITDNLFYSSKEGILFWIAGYTRNDNTENAQTFADHVGIPLEKVFTYYNTRPPRYQYMRIFYAYIPKVEGAFELGEDWTMYKWLTI